MSSRYYLASQLPSFSVHASSSLPVTEDYFIDLCSRCLDGRSVNILRSLSLEPPKECAKTSSALVDSWYEWERGLRFALAQVRAAKLKKEFSVNTQNLSADIVQIARTASGMSSPLEAEEFLNNERFAALESLRPIDEFSTDAFFYYALKLKLALRIRKFNTEAGMHAYRAIYDRILGEAT